jgi:hypothetical protein
VQLDSGYTKQQLYKKAKQYLVNSFKSNKDAWQYDDSTEVKLVYRGNFTCVGTENVSFHDTYETGNFSFNISIECKDNKYRYRIYGITADTYYSISGGTQHQMGINETVTKIYGSTKQGPLKKGYRRLLYLMLERFDMIIEQLKKAMAKKDGDSSF